MKSSLKFFYILYFVFYCGNLFAQTETIPLPEHPRPDFIRTDWANLNGIWNFKFDKSDIGESEKWYTKPELFDKKILVPFPWGSKLSGLTNEANIGWYSRKIEIPSNWDGKKVFLVFGACDWKTTVWLNEQKLGTFQGGYTPFEFDLTAYLKKGQSQTLVVKVDDTSFPFKLEGKQGYGEAKGIWQTVYMEARTQNYIKSIRTTPDIDKSTINIQVTLNEANKLGLSLKIKFLNGNQTKSEVVQKLKKGTSEAKFLIPIENMQLWDLDNPFLYDIQVSLIENNQEKDLVTTYFGMRKISVMNVPGAAYPYVALNNKPIYLQLTLDQSYHPDGFYTFPSDQFMRDEIIRSKQIGLNGNRIHIKVEVPRKLYWADKLGLLIMADVPNFWGEPDSLAQKEWEVAMRGMLNRDFNHPSIFSWVIFNETWGLFTTIDKEKNKREYLKSTQSWVEKMYNLTKQLDPSRLVEDNSPCNYDHVNTDINSWHAYLPGYGWKGFLDNVSEKTFEGSEWNFIGGNKQKNQPMMNSECGNVWGYEGSTGDVDWSWDYHMMMNELRAHPKVCGWLYTEHHDVINEWNGYYKFDRSNKYTGLEELVPGMSLKDFHSDIYLVAKGDICRKVKTGEKVIVPLTASFMTGKDFGKNLILKTELVGWNKLGQFAHYSDDAKDIPYKPWSFDELESLQVIMPTLPGLAVLRLIVLDAAGNELHHNFVSFIVESDLKITDKKVYINDKNVSLVTFSPANFTSEKWSQKQINVLDGIKVNGLGYGFFEYKVTIPEDIKTENVEYASLVLEASARQMFGKDKSNTEDVNGDFMRGKGTFDNSVNPNAYPMTDDYKSPSRVRIRINGEIVGSYDLSDNPADHRGILSWYSQPKNNKLNEAGSYGYLINANIPIKLLSKNIDKSLTVRFEVDESLPGGLAIYGEKFGRYPLDPTVVFVLK